MQAEIAVGVVLVVVEEYPDFIVAVENDAAIPILELGGLGDEFFRHARKSPHSTDGIAVAVDGETVAR
jgi:hypothetical protein